MGTTLFVLAVVTLLLQCILGVDLVLGNGSTTCLRHVKVDRGASLPKVSIVIPARNEERNLQEALQSVLGQDYPDLEFIVINDRSTDGTRAILTAMAEKDPRLRIIEISQLPQGWLGKNHALYQGAMQASGELLLFTDADIVMEPTTLRRAVEYMRKHCLDHLAVMPEVRMRGFLLGMFSSAFGIFFSVYARPWRVKDPQSRHSVGIGAFNLVRAKSYRQAGGHEPIAMRPDDDLKLGKLLKKQGSRQEMLFGPGMICVEWYSSLREVIDGLMKNSFAGVEYSVPAAIAAGLSLLLFNFWPVPALFLTHGPTRLLNGLIVLVMVAVATANNGYYGLRRWHAIGQPFGSLLFTYIIWRSMLTALWHDGIEWRGTRYPLSVLKANRI